MEIFCSPKSGNNLTRYVQGSQPTKKTNLTLLPPN